jgi:hypothetical protein
MKKLLYPLLFLFSLDVTAQVGVGTNTPDNSAMFEVQSNNRGILFPRLTSAQRTSIASPAAGLYVFDTNTNSLWYYNGAIWINTVSESTYGDMKSGFQAADHSGWIKLDGRAISTLSSNQQAVAISLGFTTSLPNATSAYPVQSTGTLGSIVGANTTTLTQANLPNVNFTGNAASAGTHGHTGTTAGAGSHGHTGNTSTDGNHNHSGATTTDGDHGHSMQMNSKDDGNFSNVSGQYPTGDAMKFYGAYHYVATENAGNHWHNLSINYSGNHSHSITTNTVSDHNHNFSTSNDGAHTHSVSVASGGIATPINIAPKSLIVNMFVYLGQ